MGKGERGRGIEDPGAATRWIDTKATKPIPEAPLVEASRRISPVPEGDATMIKLAARKAARAAEAAGSVPRKNEEKLQAARAEAERLLSPTSTEPAPVDRRQAPEAVMGQGETALDIARAEAKTQFVTRPELPSKTTLEPPVGRRFINKTTRETAVASLATPEESSARVEVQPRVEGRELSVEEKISTIIEVLTTGTGEQHGHAGKLSRVDNLLRDLDLSGVNENVLYEIVKGYESTLNKANEAGEPILYSRVPDKRGIIVEQLEKLKTELRQRSAKARSARPIVASKPSGKTEAWYQAGEAQPAPEVEASPEEPAEKPSFFGSIANTINSWFGRR